MRTGWCPGVRTTEEFEVDAMRRQFDLYPRSRAFRVFFGPTFGLPATAWTDPAQALSLVPKNAHVIVSWRDTGVDATPFVAAWQEAGHRGRLILVPHHEPEQQTGGDPTREQFRASWSALSEQVGQHPARLARQLRLAVCYTLTWVRKQDANGQRVNDWRMWWPEHVADSVDIVLGDWYPYDPTSATPYKPEEYEPPARALAIMTELAAATGKAWGIAEINHARTPSDTTGEKCAAWYRAMHAWARAHGCTIWTHFHKGGGDLGSRLPEQETLRELISRH